MSRAVVLLIAALVLGAAVVATHYARPWLVPQPPLPVIEALGGDFSLPSTLGRETRLTDFSGKLVLLNFGFASCPDVCQVVLSRMRQVMLGLAQDAGSVQPLFITVDPERDTVQKLKPYVEYFHPSFVAMSGSTERIRAVAELFKVFYRRETLPAPLDYGFLHSDQIYLIDRNGRVRATFANSATIDEMVATTRRLLAE